MSQLKVDSLVPRGGLPAGSDGGGIIQVVQTIKTDGFTTTNPGQNTGVDITGLSATITPQSSSSKILVQLTVGLSCSGISAGVRVLRGTTPIGTGSGGTVTNFSVPYAPNASAQMYASGFNFLDSPATTSATTYKAQIISNIFNGTVCIGQLPGNTTWRVSSILQLMEVSAG